MEVWPPGRFRLAAFPWTFDTLSTLILFVSWYMNPMTAQIVYLYRTYPCNIQLMHNLKKHPASGANLS